MLNTLKYVTELIDPYRYCNMCGQPVLRMPPEHAMHRPPKPYQCMSCDAEIDEQETHVGEFVPLPLIWNLVEDSYAALCID